MGGWRNERMRERGSGTGNMGEDGLPRGGGPGSRGAQPLDPRTVALVQVAAALAEGKAPALRQRLVAARAAAVPDIWIEERLLQSLPVVGHPPALRAFGAWREVPGPASARADGGGSRGAPGAHLG